MAHCKEDVDELTDFFTTHSLFSPDTTLHCIMTGSVALTSVTVDDAQSTGMRILNNMMDLEDREYIFLVSSKAKLWAAGLEVEMNGEKESVYVQPLFQHLSVTTSTKTAGARQESFLMSYAHSLHPSLTTNSSNAVEPRACWRHTEASRFRTQRKACSNVCPQRETDYISTDEAWVKQGKSLIRVCYCTTFHRVGIPWLGFNRLTHVLNMW